MWDVFGLEEGPSSWKICFLMSWYC